MGWRAEEKESNQSCYGGYCNSARQQGVTPMSFEEWKESGKPRKYKPYEDIIHEQDMN